MEKTRLEDLFMINRRFQGVAREICKTHWIVLAKRPKMRVRSEKGCGWALCVKGGIFVGGFVGNLQDTKYKTNKTSLCRGLKAKSFFFYLWSGTDTDAPARHRSSWRWGRRGSGRPGAQLRCGTERERRRGRDEVLTSGGNGGRQLDFWRWTNDGDRPVGLLVPVPGQVGRRLGGTRGRGEEEGLRELLTAGGDWRRRPNFGNVGAGGRIGYARAAMLRWVSGHANRWNGSCSASWRSWIARLCSSTSWHDESASGRRRRSASVVWTAAQSDAGDGWQRREQGTHEEARDPPFIGRWRRCGLARMPRRRRRRPAVEATASGCRVDGSHAGLRPGRRGWAGCVGPPGSAQ
jgi:hypothetical protein